MPSHDANNLTWARELANQTFNLTDITGSVDTFSIADLDTFIFETGRSLLIFGLSVGMCGTVAVFLLILAKPDKRRTPVFVLNILCLALQFLRMLMVCISYNGI